MTDKNIHADRILILDFGSQYTQLIARRVREAGVYCEIHPWDMAAAEIRAFGARGVILSGGPESVTAGAGSPQADAAVFEMAVPVLGICYGMQTMAHQLGGEVTGSDRCEFGYAEVRARGHSKLLTDIEDRVNDEGHGLLDVWMSHGDHVSRLPEGFKIIASTPDIPFAGMADEERRYYGVQFHPEVTHTAQGARRKFAPRHLERRWRRWAIVVAVAGRGHSAPGARRAARRWRGEHNRGVDTSSRCGIRPCVPRSRVARAASPAA